jgi:hypothetical protein
MWLLDFKLDFFNDAEAKEKGQPEALRLVL